MLRNNILKGITITAALVFVLTAFYVDSTAWSLADLRWQIPIWGACYAWMVLFIAANDGLFPGKKQRRRSQKKERGAA